MTYCFVCCMDAETILIHYNLIITVQQYISFFIFKLHIPLNSWVITCLTSSDVERYFGAIDVANIR